MWLNIDVSEDGSNENLPGEFLIDSIDMLPNITLEIMCFKATCLFSGLIAIPASFIGLGTPFSGVPVNPRPSRVSLSELTLRETDDR